MEWHILRFLICFLRKVIYLRFFSIFIPRHFISFMCHCPDTPNLYLIYIIDQATTKFIKYFSEYFIKLRIILVIVISFPILSEPNIYYLCN